MPFFLAMFELNCFVPRLYSRYVAPLPIDWEDYGSPNDLEDAIGTVRRRGTFLRLRLVCYSVLRFPTNMFVCFFFSNSLRLTSANFVVLLLT